MDSHGPVVRVWFNVDAEAADIEDKTGLLAQYSLVVEEDSTGLLLDGSVCFRLGRSLIPAYIDGCKTNGLILGTMLTVATGVPLSLVLGNLAVYRVIVGVESYNPPMDMEGVWFGHRQLVTGNCGCMGKDSGRDKYL